MVDNGDNISTDFLCDKQANVINTYVIYAKIERNRSNESNTSQLSAKSGHSPDTNKQLVNTESSRLYQKTDVSGIIEVPPHAPFPSAVIAISGRWLKVAGRWCPYQLQ